MRTLFAFFTAVVICASLSCGAAIASLPQIDETGTLPCCPNPRFLGPRTKDGYGKDAAFDEPSSIAYDSRDDAYFIVDPASNTVRRVEKSGRVKTIAGACDRELVMATCVGRELDGVGPTARFDKPSLIVYSPRDDALLVYDSGSSAFRLVTSSGRVSTVGRVSDVVSVAIDPVRDRLYAARDGDVLSLWPDNGYMRASLAWHAPSQPGSAYNAPVGNVNAVAVQPKSGDIFVAVHTNLVYRLHLDVTWKGEFVAGNPSSSVFWDGKDDVGSRAVFRDLSALAFDSTQHLLYVDDFRTIRSVAPDGTVKSVVGGCHPPKDARFRGEFACDYPSNDGEGMAAHFASPLNGLSIGSRGQLAVFDGSYLKFVAANGSVSTVAGNRRRQRHAMPLDWSGHYVDPFTGDTMDVIVRHDDELEISANRSGRVYDAKQGLRSRAYAFAQFWNRPTYVRQGSRSNFASLDSALKTLRCGALKDYGASNPVRNDPLARDSLFFVWYGNVDGFGTRGDPQVGRYFESRSCIAVSVVDALGRAVYEDYESRIVPHSVPDGLIDYLDERQEYNQP